jgi:hypothetical protein
MALHLKSTGIDFADFSGQTGTGNELMNDYEEGTWTAYINGNASPAVAGVGKYTKIGNYVATMITSQSISLSVVYGSGQLNIPMPFTSRSSDTPRSYIDWYFQTSGTPSFNVRAQWNGGTSNATLNNIHAANTDGTGGGTACTGDNAGNQICLFRGSIIGWTDT